MFGGSEVRDGRTTRSGILEGDDSLKVESPADEREEISLWNYLVGYVTVIGAMVGLAVLGDRLLGIHGVRTICLTCGWLFCFAAIGKPRALYLVVRNTGWFHHIASPVVMRTVLALLALMLFAFAAFAPNDVLN